MVQCLMIILMPDLVVMSLTSHSNLQMLKSSGDLPLERKVD